MQTEQEQAKELLWGKTKEVLSPSGRLFTIREQNGDDDDILSNGVLQKDLSNQNKFIQGIVIKADTESGKLTNADMDNMLLKDKYFLLFASRIHSMGEIVDFTYDWKNRGGLVEYDDDITKYIWDYSTEFPTKGHEDYFEYRMEPYTADADKTQELVLDSGKKLTFECLRVKDEKLMLKLEASQITVNRELLQRNLKLQMPNGEFVRVQSFKFFTKKDMMQIHKATNLIDSPFAPLTKIESPNEGVQPVYFPIISSPHFFFPEEI